MLQYLDQTLIPSPPAAPKQRVFPPLFELSHCRAALRRPVACPAVFACLQMPSTCLNLSLPEIKCTAHEWQGGGCGAPALHHHLLHVLARMHALTGGVLLSAGWSVDRRRLCPSGGKAAALTGPASSARPTWRAASPGAPAASGAPPAPSPPPPPPPGAGRGAAGRQPAGSMAGGRPWPGPAQCGEALARWPGGCWLPARRSGGMHAALLGARLPASWLHPHLQSLLHQLTHA